MLETCHQLARRCRHEDGVPRPGAADPVLRRPELARVLGGTPTAGQQAGVHLANEPKRHRDIAQALEAVHHRIDVARHLADIVDRFALDGRVFEAKQVRQRRLRALDLRRQHGLLADVHVEEQLLIGQQHGGAREQAERSVGRAQAGQESVEFDRWHRRQRLRDKRFQPFACRDRLDIATKSGVGFRVGHDR
jgi:hypothetical protein